MSIEKIVLDDAELYTDNNIVYIKGEINQINAEQILTPFFDKVITQQFKEVILDIRDLEFLNSAGLRSFITFLLKRKQGSIVIIRANKSRTWQRTSLNVLGSLDEFIKVEAL